MAELNYLAKITLKLYLSLSMQYQASFYRFCIKYHVYFLQFPAVFCVCGNFHVILFGDICVQFVENQGILVNVNSKNHIEASLIHYAYTL